MRRFYKPIILGIIVACGAVFLTPKSPVDNIPDEITIVSPSLPSYPLNLRIDRIGVNAPIEPVGVSDGAMDSPEFGYSIGWYRHGPRPGEVGSSVMAGHVNFRGGQDAVFTNLHKLQIGEIVTVTDNYGLSNNFIVREIKSFPIDADTSEVFSSPDNGIYLNLITCDGTWNPWINTHESRLVIFTEKI